ncbi:tyrosine-type recombinase/integrase [Nocardia vaccinii]|uniref:tyrosine-type recombinase/integrase n=1 Tax=Nocardia vaccinii TaxID=1822 RepID=UPI00083362D5|nr:site-specific integrase [Nocardia vaccinii]
MSHVEDRWFKEIPDPNKPGAVLRVKSDAYGRGMRYKVRWLTPDGADRSKSFPDKQKAAAEAFQKQLDAEMIMGRYVDPHARRRQFDPLIVKWLKGTSPDPVSREKYASRARNHITPYFGGRSIAGACTVDTVRDYLEWLNTRGLDPSSQGVIFDHLVTIMDIAVAEHTIPENPCRSRLIKRPRGVSRKIIPWTEDRMNAIWTALPDRNKIAIPLGAGCGLRMGEIMGFSPDDIRRKERDFVVQRQIRRLNGGCVFSPPKGGKTRIVPMAEDILEEIDSYLQMFEPVTITLPWRVLDGRPVSVRVLMSRDGTSQPMYGYLFLATVWVTAFRHAGLTKRDRVDGMHALRHYYASSCLAEGVSILELANYLGHSDPAVTLRHYAHLMPTSHARARRAVNASWSAIRTRPDNHGLPATTPNGDSEPTEPAA